MEARAQKKRRMLGDVEAVKIMLDKFPNDFKKTSNGIPMAWDETTKTWTTEKSTVIRNISEKAPYPYDEYLSKMRQIYRCIPIFVDK